MLSSFLGSCAHFTPSVYFSLISIAIGLVWYDMWERWPAGRRQSIFVYLLFIEFVFMVLGIVFWNV